MTRISGLFQLGAAAIAIARLPYGVSAPADAADVITDWPTIQMPPLPTLKPAAVDPKTTALFLFDFMNTNAGVPQHRGPLSKSTNPSAHPFQTGEA